MSINSVIEVATRARLHDKAGQLAAPGPLTRLEIRNPRLYARRMTERSIVDSWGGEGSSLSSCGVELRPHGAAVRHGFAWRGMAVESVEFATSDEAEVRSYDARHVLVVYERGMRAGGETFVEGLPQSPLRDLSRKLTFVPSGHRYRESLHPRTSIRLTYVYFDPAELENDGLPDLATATFVPRIMFEEPALWFTAVRLRTLLETQDEVRPVHLEALSAVLSHELLRNATYTQRERLRGGLSPWQQRRVARHIEDNLAESISLDELASLVKLSRWHFCRAFKRSFGIPPHQYHNNRRLDRAKVLLSKDSFCVTDIGLEVGFSDSSSFSVAFRKATGLSPTEYHRSLALHE